MAGNERFVRGFYVAAGVTAACLFVFGYQYAFRRSSTSAPSFDDSSRPPDDIATRSSAATPSLDSMHGEAMISIATSAQKLYRFWLQPQNLPLVFRFLQTVAPIDTLRSAWTLRGPLAASLTFESELVRHEPDKALSWRMLGGAFTGMCSVQLTSGDESTDVCVHLDVNLRRPIDGEAAPSRPSNDHEPALTLEALFGEFPGRLLLNDLQRLRASIESGALLV